MSNKQQKGIGGSSSKRTPSPVGSETVVKIMRVNGKNKIVEELATGKYNYESGAWEFDSKEESSKRWLENAFNKPPKDYPINDESFLFYIMETLLPRKGWLMDWQKGDFVDKRVGKRYVDPDFGMSDEELADWHAKIEKERKELAPEIEAQKKREGKDYYNPFDLDFDKVGKEK